VALELTPHGRVGLEGIHAPARADAERRQHGEVAAIGADVHEHAAIAEVVQYRARRAGFVGEVGEVLSLDSKAAHVEHGRHRPHVQAPQGTVPTHQAGDEAVGGFAEERVHAGHAERGMRGVSVGRLERGRAIERPGRRGCGGVARGFQHRGVVLTTSA